MFKDRRGLLHLAWIWIAAGDVLGALPCSTRPRDREVSCSANAWDIDGEGDVRILGCFRVNAEDFYTAHHELGHIYYYLATDEQDTMFADGANDGFHEAVGDFITLSAQTQTYLQQIGLVDAAAPWNPTSVT